MRLKDRVAIVTGAGGGIGRAIAAGLAREGAAVIVNDLRVRGSAEDAAAQIRAEGGRAVAHASDVQDLSTHEELVSIAEREFGKLDILVNNAGIQIREPFLDARAESWDRTFGVNLKGPYFLSQAAARKMLSSGGGKILNIASIHDSVVLRDSSIYVITKGGMRMLTRALAFELAEHKIHVNAISPGAILTGINRDVLSDAEHRDRLLQKIPLGRIGDTKDLVGAAVFLVSPESDYVTGATLYVDGGILLQ